MDALTLPGLWWVPSKGRSRVSGTLSFSENDGVRLKISRALTLTHDRIILGRAGRQEITLHNCYEIASSSVDFEITGQEYIVETAFLGAALTTRSQINFQKSVFEFTHLLDWAAITGIKTRFSGDEFTASYKRPTDISIPLRDGTLTLAFTGSYPLGGPNLAFHESVRWELTTSSKHTVDDIIKQYITPLWNLVRLSTMRDNTIERLVVYRNRQDTANQAINVIFKTGYAPIRTKRLSSSELLFSLRDIGEHLTEFINNWVTIHPSAAPMVDSLVDSPSRTKMRLTQRILNLAQAAEVYHGIFHPTETALPVAEHEQLVREILADVRDAHKSWLSQILPNTNRLTLGQRLNAIVKEATSTATILLPNSKKRRQFVYRVTKVRNDLTHRMTTNIDDELLFVIGEILFFLLTASLLSQCKIPQDKVTAILRNNFRFIRATENSLRYL
jgi:hypothetical protein